jgi:hypothetical protein
VRVPTYKAQTRLTEQVGGRGMGVRYTADDFGAGVARAQGQLAQNIGDAALMVNQSRKIADEKQRIEDEKEERINVGLAKDKAVNEFLEESESARVEAEKLPIEEREAFYNKKIEGLRTGIQGRFDDEQDQIDIGNKIDRIALGKRIGIKDSIRVKKIEDSIAENAKTEKNYISDAINGQGAALEGTLSQLEELYGGMVKRGLMTAPDAEKRKAEVREKILFEREVNVANGINDPVKAQEFITRIEADERFDPTVRRRLAAMVSGVLAGKESTLKAHKSQFTDDIASLESVSKAGIPIPEETIESIIQAGTTLDNATGEVKYSRDARQIFEANENTKIFAANLSVNAIDAVIGQSETASRGSFVNIEDRGYAAQRLTQAKEFKKQMITAYQGGTGLDFVQKRSPDSVQPFDFSDFSGSLARRQAEMRNLNGLVGYDSFTDKPIYEQSFFTKAEAIQFGQLIEGASSDELASISMSLQQAARKHPQIFEQLSTSGPDADVFAMAGALSVSKQVLGESGEPIDDFMIDSKIIFKGMNLLQQNPSLAPSQDQYLADFDDVVGDVYLQAGKEGDNYATMMKAAVAHYVGSGGQKGDDFSSIKFKESIEAVTGGIGSVNDYKVELPAGVDEGLFQKIIDEMTPEMLKALEPRGFDVVGASYEKAVAIIKSNRIVSVGTNEYGVVNPDTGAPVLQTTRPDGSIRGIRMKITPNLQEYFESDQTFFGLTLVDVPSVDYLYGEGSEIRFVQ